MAAEPLLPWQESRFQHLQQLLGAGRLGHAWLISGMEGIGKRQFARCLAQGLLCQESGAGLPCGACSACHLFSQGTHPDWFLLQPPKRLIVVDQIREAIDFANTTSQRGGHKIICIDPAESMNLNAANALLKLLEEPPAGTLLLLLTQQPGLLLATLRSRCQHLQMPLPSQEQALAWLRTRYAGSNAEAVLAMAGGAPLRALVLAEAGLVDEQAAVLQCLQDLLHGSCTPIQAARRCEKFNTLTIMESLLRCLARLAAHVQAGEKLADPRLQALASLLQTRAAERTALVLHGLQSAHFQARKALLSSNNPNALLILEQVFGEWSKLRLRPERAHGTG